MENPTLLSSLPRKQFLHDQVSTSHQLQNTLPNFNRIWQRIVGLRQEGSTANKTEASCSPMLPLRSLISCAAAKSQGFPQTCKAVTRSSELERTLAGQFSHAQLCCVLLSTGRTNVVPYTIMQGSQATLVLLLRNYLYAEGNPQRRNNRHCRVFYCSY